MAEHAPTPAAKATTTALAALHSIDTPSVCNALLSLDPSLKGRNYTLRPVVAADPAAPPFTGYAVTARFNSSEPSTDDAATLQARRFAYYRYLSGAAKPALIVMQDCGTRPGYGCLWGEINASIHQALGLRGAVVDGAIRDLGTLPAGFALLGGNVCPGSGFAHLVDFDTPVQVFGLEVKPGDLVHADRHGCVVIPSKLLADLPGALARVAQREQKLLAALGAPGFDADKLIAAWLEFEAARAH